jgi:hypothetical protein
MLGGGGGAATLAARAATRRGLHARKGTGLTDLGWSDLASRRRRHSTGPRCACPGLGQHRCSRSGLGQRTLSRVLGGGYGK